MSMHAHNRHLGLLGCLVVCLMVGFLFALPARGCAETLASSEEPAAATASEAAPSSASADDSSAASSVASVEGVAGEGSGLASVDSSTMQTTAEGEANPSAAADAVASEDDEPAGSPPATAAIEASLTTDPTGSAAFTQGMSVRLQASTGNEEGLSYRFLWGRDGWSSWGVVSDFTSEPSAQWMPPSQGDYELRVDVRNAAGDVVSATASLTLTGSYTLRDFTITPASPQPLALGLTATITPDVQGTTAGLEYRYGWQRDDWSDFGIIRDYDANPTATWTPAAAGTYVVWMDVRDLAGTVTSHYATYVVAEGAIAWKGGGLTASTTTPEAGSAVSLKSTTVGTGLTYQYAWTRDQGGSGTIQEFSSEAGATFTPAQAGDYTVTVTARDASGSTSTRSLRLAVWSLADLTVGSPQAASAIGTPEVMVSADIGCSTAGFSFKVGWVYRDYEDWTVRAPGSTPSARLALSHWYGAYDFFIDLTAPDGTRRSVTCAVTVENPYAGYSYGALSVTIGRMARWQMEEWQLGEDPTLNSYTLDQVIGFLSVSQGNQMRFVDISQVCGAAAEDIDAFIDSTSNGRNGMLHGLGSTIVEAAAQYGLNAVYLLSHAIVESGWGTSQLANGYHYEGGYINGTYYAAGTYYNFFGIGAYDNSPLSGGRLAAIKNGWNSPEAAMSGAARWISKYYVHSSTYPQRTLYAMKWDYLRSDGNQTYGWHQYATSVTWPETIAEVMNEFYDAHGGADQLPYIIPVYAAS